MSKASLLPRSRLALGLALALAAAPVFAQQTSSALSGLVVGSDGNPVAGADVIITHTESGTMRRATTDENGRYSSRGLRVGGPYTVLVLKDGFQSKSNENVYLKLAETASVSMFLEPMAPELEAVEVVAATQSSIFSPDKMGAGSNVSRDQIDSYASISRNIQDYIRLDPRISQTNKGRGEISAGGQNSRFNAIRIDGVNTSDTFGLEANNLPTLRQPISLDTIEEINIAIADYDVTQSGYTGANINAVTKSGTNEFSGSVYGAYRENKWVRENTNGTDFSGFNDEQTFGATFGGPLLKDKLFFFLAYEKFERTSAAPDVGVAGSGASTERATTAADIQRIQQIAQSVWNFDAGQLEAPGTLNQEVEDVLLKFDWNISDYHRASLRYNKTEQAEPNIRGLGFFSFNTGGGFTSFPGISLSSHWDTQVKEFESVVGQLYSDWTDSFSTEVKLSYRDYASVFALQSNLPQIAIRTSNNNVDNVVLIGTEQFRHNNVLTTETYNAYAAGNLFLGDHDIKFGVDWEENEIFNLFGRDVNGVYTFNSIDDFAAGNSASYSLNAPVNGDVNSLAAGWTAGNFGLFAQDTWAYNYNLSLTFGVRVDIPDISDKPPFNQAALTAFGFDNSKTIDGNKLVQPRFGFNYTFDSERPTQLRGGFGLFQGASPAVWMSNPFTNNGLNVLVVSGTGVFSPDPNNQPRPNAIPPAQTVDIIHPDLEQPSVWKGNLAFEHELPWHGIVAGAEVILTDVDQGLYYRHLNLGAPTRQGPDGRNLFWSSAAYDPANWNANGTAIGGRGVSNRQNRNRAFGNVMLIEPTSKGGGEQLTLSLSKPLSDAWSWALAYTYTSATEVSPLTSSQAESNWRGDAIFQANEEIAEDSNYATRDRFTGALSYRHFFFEGYKTETSVFYEGRKGVPYSYTYRNDANGDGRINDLFYVPSGPGDVVFVNAAEETAFWNYVNNNEYLSANLGRVVGANTAYSSWVNSFDVRISQELPGFFEGHKSMISLDIINFGNLLNKDWGRIVEAPFATENRNVGVASFGGIDPATGRYVYRFNSAGANEVLQDGIGQSRWQAQISFRYSF